MKKLMIILLLVALIVIVAMPVNAQDEGEACLTELPKVVLEGSGVSGPVFVDNAEYREHVFEAFDGVAALDMETWAAYYVADNFGVPAIAFRSLSDLAGGGPGANEIGTFFQLAANNAALVGDAFFAEMSKSWEDEEPVLVLSAFGAELEAVLALPDVQVTEVEVVVFDDAGENMLTVYHGTWHSVPVVMALSRVSMVPATFVTTVMMMSYDVSAMVFSGIAGGVDPTLDIGDVTVPVRWANHSRSRYARDLGDGTYDADSELPNFGMIFHNPTEGEWWVSTDPDLLEVAARAAQTVDLAQCAGE